MNKLETKLFKNWWLLATKGFLTLFFGIIVLTTPDIKQIIVLQFFCAIISASGLLLIFGGFYNLKRKMSWKWWIIEGVFDFIIGIFIITVIFRQRLTAFAGFAELIAIWSLVFGVIQIITTFRFRFFSIGWFAMLISGLLAVSYTGVILQGFFSGSQSILPGTDAKIMVIGFFTIVLGLVIMLNANHLRKIVSSKK